MIINITDEAKDFIKKRAGNKIPTVCLVKAGCAGNMLVLKLMEKSDTIQMFEDIAVSKEVLVITDNISIFIKTTITQEIVVINNNSQNTCKCGKSFKI